MFRRAAGSGAWRPDLSAVCLLSPKLLELVLVLPTPLFHAIAYLTRLRAPDVCSPLLWDISNGRATNVQWQLEELVSAGKRHQQDMPVSSALLGQVLALEQSVVGRPHVVSGSPQSLAAIERLVFASTPHAVKEVRNWTMKFFVVCLFIVSIYHLAIAAVTD